MKTNIEVALKILEMFEFGYYFDNREFLKDPKGFTLRILDLKSALIEKGYL